MVPLSRYITYFSVAGAGCAVDLASKYWVFQRVPLGHTWWLWTDKCGLQTTLNEGALFGMGRGMWPVFSAFAFLAAIGIFVWLFFGGAAKQWWLTITLSLVTAGIFGNLYDRLGMPGLVWREGVEGHQAGETVHAVRDFILMKIGPWSWPNYNVADSMLVCGAIMLLLHAFFYKADLDVAGDAPPEQ